MNIMRTRATTARLQRTRDYHAHRRELIASGHAVVSYPCPACLHALHAALPAVREEFRVECPYCDERHTRVTRPDGDVLVHAPGHGGWCDARTGEPVTDGDALLDPVFPIDREGGDP